MGILISPTIQIRENRKSAQFPTQSECDLCYQLNCQKDLRNNRFRWEKLQHHLKKDADPVQNFHL